MKQLTNAEALRILASTKPQPFTKHDWSAFSGCSSQNPMIYYGTDFYLLVDEDNEGESVLVV